MTGYYLGTEAAQGTIALLDVLAEGESLRVASDARVALALGLGDQVYFESWQVVS